MNQWQKYDLKRNLSNLKGAIQSGKKLLHVRNTLQTVTTQMSRTERNFNWSHTLVQPDGDGKTPLFYASQSGHVVIMSFLLSVFFVSRVEMSPKNAKLELPFDQWFNVIGKPSMKKMCIAAAGNQAMRDLMTNEVQTIEGMVTTILSSIGNEIYVPTYIKTCIANAVRAKSASSKNKRTNTSKKKPTLATDKDDEYNYLDTYYDGDDEDDVEEYNDISNNGMSKVQRVTHDLHDIAEDRDNESDAQDIEEKEESHSEAWIGEERESLQNTDSFCIEIKNLHLDLEAIEMMSKTIQNAECDWSLVSDDKESWEVIPDVQSVQSFSSSIPFSYKDAILMKLVSDEQVVNSRDTPPLSEQCRKKPAEETVKDEKSNERIYDSFFLRDGYKGGRGKGNISRHYDARRQRQTRR
jgi:hypothetical protein